ncbi:hypothetical protein ES705_18122 [subsurface metagenome]
MGKTVAQNAKMKPGECRRTKAGVQYCRTSKGVRFTRK